MPKTIISILIQLRMNSDLRSKLSISQLHIALPLSYQTVSRSNLTLNIPPQMIDSINIKNLTLHGLCNSTLLDICESNLIVGTLTWRETKYQCTPDQEMFVRETGKWKFIRTICTPVLQMFMPTIVFAGTYWWLESSLQYFCNFCFLQSLEVVLARNQQWKHWISLLCCSS